MKYISIFSWLTVLGLLTSACQTTVGGGGTDNTAVGRVTSALNAYRAGDGNRLEEQFTSTERKAGYLCPGQQQLGCMRVAYQNFAAAQNAAGQSPQSFTLLLYDKQTTPNIQMVLVEGKWGGNPAVVSCQVFFVMTNGSTWLIDNYDEPEAITCQQRSEALTENLFGSSATPTPANP